MTFLLQMDGTGGFFILWVHQTYFALELNDPGRHKADKRN